MPNSDMRALISDIATVIRTLELNVLYIVGNVQLIYVTILEG